MSCCQVYENIHNLDCIYPFLFSGMVNSRPLNLLSQVLNEKVGLDEVFLCPDHYRQLLS